MHNFIFFLCLPTRTFLTFANGLLRIPIHIDAKEPEKLQHFSEFAQNCEKAGQIRPGLYANIVLGQRFYFGSAVSSFFITSAVTVSA